MRRIATATVVLEPQVAGHAEEMFAVLSDPAIYAHENEPPPSVEWLRARFARLESRRSPRGDEQWLNWVLREPRGGLVGYVQATVHADGRAAIAYVLSSAHWGRGLARAAIEAMIGELEERHGASRLTAVLKRANLRSLRLLERLGFAPADPAALRRIEIEPDEMLMQRALRAGAEPAKAPA
jgi:RimJ/RimL family protein N-acetyltransferase